jgi:hypothetical protein
MKIHSDIYFKKWNCKVTPVALFLLVGLTFAMNSAWPRGMKGSLEGYEIDFLDNVIYPSLIKAGICRSIHKDCQHDFIICSSNESLSCSIYGVSDAAVIQEIMIEVVRSDIAISEFKFWRSTYRNKSLLENPLASYSNILVKSK